MIKYLIIAFFALGCACNPTEDTETIPAIDAGDITAIMQGFNKDSHQGMLHIRVSEGAKPSGMISVFMPFSNCKRESCAEVKAIRDGDSFPVGGIINDYPHGVIKIPLSYLIRDDQSVNNSHGGVYRLLIDFFYESEDGEEHGQMLGIIFISVLDKGYTPLSCSSPNVGFIAVLNSRCKAHFTTKGRSALCGEGC